MPSSGWTRPDDRIEAGGLAGAVGAEQADHLAAAHLQADVAQHWPAAELLAQTVRGEADRAAHQPGPGPASIGGGVANSLRACTAIALLDRLGRRGLYRSRRAGRARRRPAAGSAAAARTPPDPLPRRAAGGARHRGEHLRAAGDQIDLEPLAAHHVLVRVSTTEPSRVSCALSTS